MARELFKTFEEAESAWFEIKEQLQDQFDDPEEDDEDELNRETDDEFSAQYGFDLMDF